MAIFTLLLTRLIPLYITVLLGFIAARVLKVDRESISKIVFYLIVPMVFFYGTYHVPITPGILALPLLSFAIGTLLCGLFYAIGRRVYHDSSANVMAMTAGNGNTGYFGLPVALMLFDKQTVDIYLVLILGVSIFESSVGYYITARGRHTVREAFLKLLRLPVLYGFLLGLIMNLMAIRLPDVMEGFFANVRICYSVLGMMIVGLALASIRTLKLDWVFIGLCFLAKFIAWPVLCIGFVTLDNRFWHLYSAPIHNTIVLLSIVPMAANTVVIADLLGAKPEKAAAAVFLSTLLAIVYVPLMAMCFIH